MSQYTDRSLIGYIDFMVPINERQIGKNVSLRKIGKCKVEVYGDEGQIPHFHITADNFDCCIKIHSPEYFDHGYHMDKLNNIQAVQLDQWLRMDNDRFKERNVSISNWNIIDIGWEECNPDCKFPNKQKTKIQPNYTKLNKED